MIFNCEGMTINSFMKNLIIWQIFCWLINIFRLILWQNNDIKVENANNYIYWS
jgi:hypothetical protein